MSIKSQFKHEFTGFWHTEAKCHVRILEDDDKPTVVICSQLRNYTGTSVTNAAEHLARELQAYLMRDNLTLTAACHKYMREATLAKMLADLVAKLKESRTMTIFALESIKMALEFHERRHRGQSKAESVIWVEHYPKEEGPLGQESYSIVTFEKETWSPSWSTASPSKLSAATGYPETEFVVSPELLLA